MRDIFTLEELNDANPEHVIPASLGGRRSSRELINRTTNNEFGSTFDDQLAGAFLMIVNALGMESRRGKTTGYMIEPTDGSKYNLASGFKPELRKPNIREELIDGKRVLLFEARSPQEARKLIEGMKRKYGNKLDEASLKIQEKSEFINTPFKVSLSFGGPFQLRAIGKILFEFTALVLGNDVACSKDFDLIRKWIIEAIDHQEEYIAGKRKDLDPLFTHDYRESTWEGLPSLENAPFQHRVFIFGGKNYGGVWGCIEFFGHMRFSGVLSRDVPSYDFSFSHFVDPLTGAMQERADLTSNIDIVHISEHDLSLDAAKNALSALMTEIYKRHTERAHESLAEEAARGYLPGSGEVITPENINKLSRFVAEGFVRQHFRIDNEREITLDELNKMIENDLKKKDLK